MTYEVHSSEHQYAHPGYWSPHHIGDGDVERVQNVTPTRAEVKTAKGAVAAYGRRSGAGVVLQSFVPGNEFSVDGFEPGTILHFDAEYLYAAPNTIVDPVDFKTIEVPQRRIDRDVTYRSSVLWYTSAGSRSLVLKETKRKPRAIVGKHTGSVATRISVPFAKDGGIYHPTNFVVGEVFHHSVEPTDELLYPEVISRINRVDVLMFGSAVRKRRFAWLPSLRTSVSRA